MSQNVTTNETKRVKKKEVFCDIGEVSFLIAQSNNTSNTRQMLTTAKGPTMQACVFVRHN